jgi:hypothetical protein
MFGTGTFASAPFAALAGGSNAFANPTGVNAVAYLNSVTVTQLVFPIGVEGIGDTGVPSITVTTSFLITGVEGLGRTTTPLVWGEINSTSAVTWVEIPT